MKSVSMICGLMLCCGAAMGQAVMTDACGSAPVIELTSGGTLCAPTPGTDIAVFDLSLATNDAAGTCGGTATSPDMWVGVHCNSSGQLTANTCNGGAAFDTVLAIYDGCGGISLGCNDDSCGLQSSLTVNVIAGQTVYVRIARYNTTGPTTGAGTVNLTLSAGAPTPQVPPVAGSPALETDAGDLPATAQQMTGSGPLSGIAGNFTGGDDVDMYLVEICDPANFGATTFGGATVDTQIFVFNADGVGVVHSDDMPPNTGGTGLQSFAYSNICGPVTTAGQYYIAVARYNRDPVDAAGALLWANTPFASNRTPDGPGAASPVAAWTGTTTGDAPYTLTLTGVCYVGGGNPCDPFDLNGDTVVDFNDYLEFLNLFNAEDPRVDYNADGVVDFNDYLEFLNGYNACS